MPDTIPKKMTKSSINNGKYQAPDIPLMIAMPKKFLKNGRKNFIRIKPIIKATKLINTVSVRNCQVLKKSCTKVSLSSKSSNTNSALRLLAQSTSLREMPFIVNQTAMWKLVVL